MLVPTLAPGVNTHDIGAIIEFGAPAVLPTVRGVHFQPISFFGRYPQPPQDEKSYHSSRGDQCRSRSKPTGAVLAESFRPPGGENALCSFHGNFVLMPDDQLKPLTRHKVPIHAAASLKTAPRDRGASREFVAHAWSTPTL